MSLLIALQHDFTEALTIIHNEETQYNHFGRSVNVSIEGCTVHYCHPSDESKQFLDFHSFMSDDTTQMASTVYFHMDMLIQKLMDSKIISKGGRVLYQTDGCAKQYKCDTAIYFMSLLATKHEIVVDRAISASGHVKSLVGKCLIKIQKRRIKRRCAARV